ncbi:hypothetical protein [Methylocystis rosea]|uniref:Uncharacterized protein n=1 Tax=Methylocystis rosea TaxID=173366 RepID=A0A3G8M3P7_9HYPH|nr:hypothetical protein [Methylocystis rosea]AZG75548.1 hypothetical protein EHO51_01645 [Methylocystis rosea]
MDDFDMQPLSKIKPDAITTWGVDRVMLERPKIAAKVAQYITKWTDVETLLGVFLAILLHAHEEAAMAIFTGIENRTAQLKMITSAAEASLPGATFEAVSALLTSMVKPAMKYRDKLAHWTWGLSDDLPNDLVISEPKDKLASHLKALKIQAAAQSRRTPDVETGNKGVYVVREKDLDAAIIRLEKTEDCLATAMGTCWQANAPKTREKLLEKLSNEPPIREALSVLARRKGSREAQ